MDAFVETVGGLMTLKQIYPRNDAVFATVSLSLCTLSYTNRFLLILPVSAAE